MALTLPSLSSYFAPSLPVELGVKLDKPSFPSMSVPPPAAPDVDDEEGPVVWYHEGPPELTTARYWIADYSISKYSTTASVLLIGGIFISQSQSPG